MDASVVGDGDVGNGVADFRAVHVHAVPVLAKVGFGVEVEGLLRVGVGDELGEGEDGGDGEGFEYVAH